MICDTMVGSLFQHFNIHAVIVGADRIAKNGDTANKVCSAGRARDKECNLCVLQIGTYNAAVLAARHKIAFIVVAPISTVDLEIPHGSQYVPSLASYASPADKLRTTTPVFPSNSDLQLKLVSCAVQCTPHLCRGVGSHQLRKW